MIDQKKALELFKYVDGDLFWKTKRSFGINAGDKAGSFDPSGYIKIGIDGKTYYAHRIIFLMHNGYLPKYIDHIDGVEFNNKIENLRATSKAQNQYNSNMMTNNTTGVKNVYRDSRSDRWFVKFVINGKQKFFGYFLHFDEAAKVADDTRQFLHGGFARDCS